MATKIDRAEVLASLPAKYDRSTVRILASGMVTARIDPDVVPGTQHIPRLNVGYVVDLLRQADRARNPRDD